MEGFTTDAERFAVETGGNGAVRRVFLRGTGFSGGGVSLRSGAPLSASVNVTAEGIELEADMEKAADVSLRLAKAPVEATVNGVPVKKLNFDKKTQELRLALPAGHVMAKVK